MARPWGTIVEGAGLTAIVPGVSGIATVTPAAESLRDYFVSADGSAFGRSPVERGGSSSGNQGAARRSVVEYSRQ